ncbi:hypothetical protein [uncultured Mediterranean phage uvMED]|nr:hypothetical protein [uncultured Mediterranean phage uvMED]
MSDEFEVLASNEEPVDNLAVEAEENTNLEPTPEVEEEYDYDDLLGESEDPVDDSDGQEEDDEPEEEPAEESDDPSQELVQRRAAEAKRKKQLDKQREENRLLKEKLEKLEAEKEAGFNDINGKVEALEQQQKEQAFKQMKEPYLYDSKYEKEDGEIDQALFVQDMNAYNQAKESIAKQEPEAKPQETQQPDPTAIIDFGSVKTTSYKDSLLQEHPALAKDYTQKVETKVVEAMSKYVPNAGIGLINGIRNVAINENLEVGREVINPEKALIAIARKPELAQKLATAQNGRQVTELLREFTVMGDIKKRVKKKASDPIETKPPQSTRKSKNLSQYGNFS